MSRFLLLLHVEQLSSVINSMQTFATMNNEGKTGLQYSSSSEYSLQYNVFCYDGVSTNNVEKVCGL